MKPFNLNLTGLNRFSKGRDSARVEEQKDKNTAKGASFLEFGRWKRIAGLFLAAFLLLAGVQSFTACDLLGAKSDDSIVGEWKSPANDGYRIKYDATIDVYRIEYFDTYGFDFKGIVVSEYTTRFTAKEGFIVFKVTEKGSSPLLELEVGKYSVVRWEDFTGDTIMMGIAWKNGGMNEGMDTPQQAALEYTVENGYFAGLAYSTGYQRQ